MNQGVITGLILAAGESSRMRQDKALLQYHGRPFLEVIIGTLRAASVGRIAVVLGYHALEIQRGVNLDDVQVIRNPDYREGQTSSLQAGLRALEASNPEAILLCLVDHPAISPEVIRQLCAGFQKSRAPVVVPTYRGRRGHPALIGSAVFHELLDLKPGDGANTVIQKYETCSLEVEDPGVLVDIDLPEDYRRLAEP
jgi:molybdenum cofactor cytidylyltransferase